MFYLLRFAVEIFPATFFRTINFFENQIFLIERTMMPRKIKICLFLILGCLIFELTPSYAVEPKSELILKNGFKRDKKDNDPEIHLKNGIVLEAQSNGHLEAEQTGKDLGDHFLILSNQQGTHDIYVIGKKSFVLIMGNVFVRRDKGDGDWEVLLSRKWDLWLEIDSNCESKEFLLAELETGAGKDIDLKKIFGLR